MTAPLPLRIRAASVPAAPQILDIPTRLDELAPTMRAWLTDPELLAVPTPIIPYFAWPKRITLYSAPDKGVTCIRGGAHSYLCSAAPRSTPCVCSSYC